MRPRRATTTELRTRSHLDAHDAADLWEYYDDLRSALLGLRHAYAGTDMTADQALAWVRADAVLEATRR
jgi:hypothetical protein